MPERAAAIAALLPKAEGNPRAMLQLAKLLRDDGREADAVALAHRAMALAPDDREIALNAGSFLAAGIAAYHFAMLRDGPRLAAYDAALRRAIRPGMRVLEIGTGTGVLAMMAARAGAAEVVTCEMNPAMAEVARQTVMRNGYAGRVRVITKHSDALDVEADLGGRADLLVSEVISNDLLSEGVLAAHARAVRQLLKPGAPVVPARGTIRVALAEGPETVRIGTADGFDLSAIETLRDPVLKMRNTTRHMSLRSAPHDLFTFDFADEHPSPTAEACVWCKSRGGRVNGVVQWIALALDEVTAYENAPDPHGPLSHWGLRFVAMRRPVDTTPGQTLRVRGSHTRERVLMWVDES